jgi:hypothetical protein
MIAGRPWLLQNKHTSRKIKGVWQQSAFLRQVREDRIEDRGNRLKLIGAPVTIQLLLKNLSFSLNRHPQ